MALSCLSVMGSSMKTQITAGGATFLNRTLTSTAFTSNTRTDANYGLITVVMSATGGNITTYGVSKMLDNNAGTEWQSLNSDYTNYYNEAGTSVALANAYTGGEYSDSNNTVNAVASGLYYGFKVSGVQFRFTTNYLDGAGASQTAYGSYVTVFFNSTSKALLKSFTIGGNTSYNWDDVPRDILVVGSNDGSNWNLIQDASNFYDSSPWFGYTNKQNYPGFRNSLGGALNYAESTYAITTTSKYRYLRFVVRRLVRGRVLALWKFDLNYDIYIE